MSATIEVIKQTGAAPGSETSVSGIELKSVDDAVTAAADAPIVILDSGINYSYESWVKFKCTVAPDNQCTDFKVWGSGSAIQGGNFKITVNTDAVSSYATPVNAQSSQGTRDDLVNHDTGSKVDVAGTLTGTGQSTDFVVFQAEVFDTALPGNVAQQTVYYEYTET